MLTRACTAFEGTRCIASGDLCHVARKTKEVLDRGEHAPVLVFDDTTSQVVELDFRGSPDDVLARIAMAQPPASAEALDDVPRRPGRPRLGVVPREVTLLPRHWDWLNSQPGGASVALRKLVEEARRVNESKDRIRVAREVTYRFMSAMAGNEPGFEEAARALFAGRPAQFEFAISHWPVDIRLHTQKLAAAAFPTA